jgi:hypothetical protein
MGDKMSITGRKSAQGQVDPLYVIFEQHLLNFQESDTDRKTFVGNIITDYLSYLRKLNISVPKSLEQPIIEELATQVSTMLAKKIYGCVSIEEYRQKVAAPTKRRAKDLYSKLNKPNKLKAG